MDTTEQHPRRIDNVMRKVAAYARRHSAYPFPEELFFREIITKCIAEAHGNCGEEQVRKLKVKAFWEFAKIQALVYISSALAELRGPLRIPRQEDYYALKLGTAPDKVVEKLQVLKTQFEESLEPTGFGGNPGSRA